jgi:hypothetical protein
MGRPRKNQKVRVPAEQLFHAAGEGIWNASAEFDRYFKIKEAGGDPEVYFSRQDGYSVVDGLAQAILENRIRHGNSS